MRFSSLLIALGLTGGMVCAAEPAGPDPDSALRDLLAGNRRFVEGKAQHPHQSAERRIEVAKDQHPFAIILGCADSRVAPEILFDEGDGDLFVVRVAGNVVSNEVLGSIEYAVQHLGTRLIVVLGHQRCGAVSAAVEGGQPEGHLVSLMDAIMPAVRETKGTPGDPVENAMRANVVRQAGAVRRDDLISRASAAVKVVAARYDLEAGAVEILKEPRALQ